MSDVVTTMHDGGHEIANVPPRGVWLPYKELVELRSEMSNMRATLQAALALQGTVADHEQRIAKLERGDAFDAGRKLTWKTVPAFIGGIISAIITGGALQYLQRSTH